MTEMTEMTYAQRVIDNWRPRYPQSPGMWVFGRQP